ncbi:unnamed protein product, partial [Timema podura]|nr:unnamed protein product [Timema podura]
METNTRLVCGSCEGRMTLIADDLQDKLDCAVQVGILRVSQDRYTTHKVEKQFSLGEGSEL